MTAVILQYYDSNSQSVLAIQVYDASNNSVFFLSNQLLTEEIVLQSFLGTSASIEEVYYLVSDDYLNTSILQTLIEKLKDKLIPLNHENIKKYYNINSREKNNVYKYVVLLYEKILGSHLKDWDKKNEQDKINVLFQIIQAVDFKNIISNEYQIPEVVKNFISSIKEIRLTSEQISALVSFKQFIDTKQDAFFVLSGSAGTGKTTLVKYLLNFYTYYTKSSLHQLMAPTGKASRVLSNKTGITCYTIHKSIYTFKQIIREEFLTFGDYAHYSPVKDVQLSLYSEYELSHLNDFDIIEQQGLAANTHPVDFIVLDEASMITDFLSEEEVRIEHEKARKHGREYINCTGFHLHDLVEFIRQSREVVKIVLVGDHCQLPPVQNNKSECLIPALDKRFLLEKYKNFKLFHVHLSEAHRFANEEIYLFSLYLRNRIENKPKSSYGSSSFSKTHGYVFNEVYSSFLNQYPNVNLPDLQNNELLIKLVANDLREKTTKAIVITYRNSYADYINASVRTELGKKFPIEKDDICICVHNNYSAQIYNGDIFVINKIHSVEFIELLNFKTGLSHIVPLFICDIVYGNYVQKRVYMAFDIDNYLPHDILFDDWSIHADKKTKNYSNIKFLLKMNFKNRMTWMLYKRIENALKNILKGRDSSDDSVFYERVRGFQKKHQIKDYKDFKSRFSPNKVIKEFKNVYADLLAERLGTDKYLNAILFKYSYAITCHKAQGSEWEKVYVTDINTNELNWLYTAATRASKSLIFSHSNTDIPKFNKPFKSMFRITRAFQGTILNVVKIQYVDVKLFENYLQQYFLLSDIVASKSEFLNLVDGKNNYAFIETSNDLYIVPVDRLDESVKEHLVRLQANDNYRFSIRFVIQNKTSIGYVEDPNVTE